MESKDNGEQEPHWDDGSAGQRLEELRTAIDGVDAELLAALNRRAALSLEVGALKAGTRAPVLRPERETALLDRLTRGNKGPLPNDHLVAVYREILSSSRALQRPQRVAYLGPEGTFSHMAGQEYLGQANEFTAFHCLAAVFDAVQKRECDLGVVPIENSLNGSVGQSLDSFATHDVHIQAEWFSRIALTLLSKEPQTSDIGVVYSHPQPLGQCAAWLRENLPQATLVSLESTAAAALKAAREPGSACIGDARLSSRFGLHVLARNIEDLADNWTRFFVVGHAPLSGTAGQEAKTSIMFSLADKPGGLCTVLSILAGAGINMSKLESRPMRAERWKYIFFADLDCDIRTPEHAAAMEAAAGHCLSARILGTYARGRHVHATT